METENEDTIDYGAILSDLEAKKAAIEAAITGLKAMMSVIGTAEGMSFVKTAATLVNPSIHGGEIPAGAFHGKSIPEAVKAYLSLVKKKQTTREIADALEKGGMQTNSKGKFDIIVGSALYRVREAGEIVRVKGAWGLAEWWPAGIRASQGKQGKLRKGKPKKSARKKSEKPAVNESSPRSELKAKGTQEWIIEFLKQNPDHSYASNEVAKALKIDAHVAAMTLGRLASKNKIEKLESGKYRAAQ